MNIFRRPSSSRASSESTSASASATSSSTVSPSTSRSASLTRYSSDASYFGPRSTRVQHDIVGNFIIREIYNTKPNGWYLRVQLVSGGGKDRKGKGKGKDNGSTQFSIPITKKARRSAGVQWDLSTVFDAEFPDWKDNEKTRRKMIEEYHLASLSYFEYAAKRPGGTPPRQVCQFEMEKQIKQQYSLLRRLLNNVALFR